MRLWPLLRNMAIAPKGAAPTWPSTPAPDPTQAQQSLIQTARWQLPVLMVTGSDYEMGWQQGHHLGEALRALVAGFYEQFTQRRLERWFYRQWLPSRLHHFWHQTPASYQAEMAGMAAGAGLPLEDILLVNFFDDILNLVELGWAIACSTVLSPDQGQGPRLGRNLDYNGPVGDIVRHHQALILRYPVAPRQPTVSVSVVGQVGILTGMNQAGVCLGSMTAQSRERTWQGQGVSLIYREMLDTCATAAAALTQLAQATPAQGNNLMLADPQQGASIQMTSRRQVVTPLGPEPLYLTNHYVDTALATTQTALYAKTVAMGSLNRYQRLCDCLGQSSQGQSSPNQTPQNQSSAGSLDLAAIMTDCQPAQPLQRPDPWWSSQVVNNQGTLHSVIFEPQDRRLTLALGLGAVPITAADYTDWSWSKALSPASQAPVSSHHKQS